MSKLCKLVLLLCMLPILAKAAELPTYSPVYGQAMAGIVQHKAMMRCYAADDPRLFKTSAQLARLLQESKDEVK